MLLLQLTKLEALLYCFIFPVQFLSTFEGQHIASQSHYGFLMAIPKSRRWSMSRLQMA